MKRLLFLALILLFSATLFSQYPPPATFPKSYKALEVRDSLNLPFLANGPDTLILVVNNATGKVDSIEISRLREVLGSGYDLQYVTDNGATTTNNLTAPIIFGDSLNGRYKLQLDYLSGQADSALAVILPSGAVNKIPLPDLRNKPSKNYVDSSQINQISKEILSPYTLQDSDAGKLLYTNSATDINVTIPLGLNWNNYQQIVTFEAYGEGDIVLTDNANTTDANNDPVGTVKVRATYLRKKATDTYVLGIQQKFLLTSPDGTKWEVEVDNAGNLTTTAQ